MRTAILGAAASALLGGTLAITPLTSVSSAPVPGGPACANGCDQAGAVLMPETAKPQAPAASPAAEVGEPSNRAAPAANLIAPGASAQGSSGAYTASPGVSAEGGAPGLGGEPDVPGMDEVAPAVAGLTSIPEDAAAVQSVWGTAGQAHEGRWDADGGAAGVLSSVSVSLFYLQIAGLLPQNFKLPSGLGLSSIPGVSLPTSLQSAISQLPPSVQSAISGASLPAAAARVPGAAAAIRGAAPGGPGPLAAIRAAIPQVGLPRPALPATPGWRALPHPHLPGPAAVLKPHCIGPHLGPIGACIP